MQEHPKQQQQGAHGSREAAGRHRGNQGQARELGDVPWPTSWGQRAEKEQSWGKSLRLQLAVPVAQFHKHCNYLFSSKGIFFFSNKIRLEMTFFAVTEDHLHSILYLPLSRCGWKITYSAHRHSWVPAPASPLPGLMRRHQRRGFDSSAHHYKASQVTPAASNIETRRPRFQYRDR